MSSSIWRYFDKVVGDKAKCRICNVDASRKGGSTKAMWDHLRHHKEEYDSLKSDKQLEPAPGSSQGKIQQFITKKDVRITELISSNFFAVTSDGWSNPSTTPSFV